MAQSNIPPVINPTVDVEEELSWLIGDVGTIYQAMGGYKIAIHHAGAFPWDEVFKALLYRGFQVWVTRHKADLFIEAKP